MTYSILHVTKWYHNIDQMKASTIQLSETHLEGSPGLESGLPRFWGTVVIHAIKRKACRIFGTARVPCVPKIGNAGHRVSPRGR